MIQKSHIWHFQIEKIISTSLLFVTFFSLNESALNMVKTLFGFEKEDEKKGSFFVCQ